MERVKQLVQVLPADVDGMLVWQPHNRRWLTGFTGSSGVAVVARDKEPVFVTDFRYTQQAGEQCRGFKVVQHGREFAGELAGVVKDLGIKRLGFEKDYLTVGQHQKVEQGLDGVAQLVPLDDLVLELRSIKTEAEIELLSQAICLADKSFAHILGFLRPGLSERQVALELERHMQDLGARGASFEIIVASGPRSALPHGVASDRVLQTGEFVKMDFGCVYNGYCSDITRTVVLGKASDKQKEIYNLVLKAQLAAINGIKSGITGQQGDSFAREIIADAGYGDNFGHGLGHGIGLAVHEMPRLAPGIDKVLAPNNVVTVEPGIYIPDWGGVRIEDMVVVTGDGCRVLTGSSKELIEV